MMDSFKEVETRRQSEEKIKTGAWNAPEFLDIATTSERIGRKEKFEGKEGDRLVQKVFCEHSS